MPADAEFAIPDEYLLELGKIVVAWGKLESLLTHTLVFAAIDKIASYPRALAVFANMGFQQKLDALSTMIHLIEKEFADLYQAEVQALLKKAQENRNIAMHQFWEATHSEVFRSNVKAAKGKLKVTTQEVSLHDLKEVLLSIDKAHDALLAAINFPLRFKFKPQEGQ